MQVPETLKTRLADEDNPHFLYDLLGLFKGAFVPRFFRQPDGAECPLAAAATQLARVKAKCREKELMEISGVDINSSRQSFRCPEVTQPEFVHLSNRTWALIAHEHFASRGGWGLFDPENPMKDTPLEILLDVYARPGLKV